MSNHNYSQYSSKKNRPVNHQVDEVKMEETVEQIEVVETVVEPVTEPIVETVETVTLPESVVGTVTNCAKLNIRINPRSDADVQCVADADTELIIDTARSTSDWLRVCTPAGIEGYCMRKFVKATL